ncbi:MAG: glycosyltransferase family 2 protein [Gemmatimonas sp.]
MITLVVPTRNRAHTIRIVGESFYRQRLVSEIIFVDDGGTDDSHQVIAEIAARFPETRTVVLRNERRMGAAYSRIRGYENATNEYVMYTDDDIYIAPGYAATCLGKMQSTGAAIVSGRRAVFKRGDQTPEQAIAAFGNGLSNLPPVRKYVCEFREDARFDGDVEMPLTNPVILTRKSLLQELSYDPFYSKGNGFREESDFQMNAFVNGHKILVTNDAFCVELSRAENNSGGNRVNHLARAFWNVYYTNYFYRKYWDRYAARMGLRIGRRTAVALYALYQVQALFIRPIKRRLMARLGDLFAAPCRRGASATP